MAQIKSYMTNFKAILAIDFDRTICMSNYPDLGEERKDVVEVMNELINEGYGIIINTCREGIPLYDAILWMDHHNIPYHYLNCNFPHVIEMYNADCRKISADLYIDDKCLTGLPEWREIKDIVCKKFG